MKKILNSIETTRKVICITGSIAAGKTLCMSTIANEFKEELQADLYSNYSLYGSQDIKELSFSVFDLLAFTENENVIILFDSYNINRIPESLIKIVDLHLSAEKIDSDTIKLTGINADYEKAIKITESAIYYNAFDLPKLRF